MYIIQNINSSVSSFWNANFERLNRYLPKLEFTIDKRMQLIALGVFSVIALSCIYALRNCWKPRKVVKLKERSLLPRTTSKVSAFSGEGRTSEPKVNKAAHSSNTKGTEAPRVDRFVSPSNTELRNQEEELKGQIKRLEEQGKQTEKTLQLTQDELVQAKEQAKAEKQRLEDQVKELTQAKDVEQKTMAMEIAGLQYQIAELRKKGDQPSQEVPTDNNLLDEMDHLQKQVEQLKDALAKIHQAYQEANSQVQELQEENKALFALGEKSDQTIKTLRGQIAALQKEALQMPEKVPVERPNKSPSVEKLKEAEKELAEAKESCNELSEELEKEKRKNRELYQTINKLNKEKTEQEQLMQAINEENTRLNSILKSK